MSMQTTSPETCELGHTPQPQTPITNRVAELVLLTTDEAAEYMRRSTSWLLHRRDIAYLPGKPNLYRRKDLDTWVDRNAVRPRWKI